MGTPVKLKVDDFEYLGEKFEKGDIFNAPTDVMASFLCEQEGVATRVKEDTLESEKPGTNRRMPRGAYNTKVMTPENPDGAPIGGKEQAPAAPKKKASTKKSKS